MIIYTDLYNRTKNYTLPEHIKEKINEKFNVQIVTTPNSKAEIYWGDKLNEDHLEKMPNIKWIHLSKTGYDKFNLPANTLITNTPESSKGVAEFALSCILFLLRGMGKITLDRKSFDHNIESILLFNEVKCLIVGYGRIGKKLESYLKSIGMKVGIIQRKDNIKNNLNAYDFIINTLPLNPSTKNYFSIDIFGNMNPNSYIINVGRGETIIEEDLIYAIKNKIIKGAFLDVVQNEPIKPNNKLLKIKNIYISPHIANSTKNSLDIQVKSFTKNLEKYINNQELENIIT